jgi:Asp-tRNA(Asn)/Glu-tRNA(Gln) amidotransferase A subunit family amidase
VPEAAANLLAKRLDRLHSTEPAVHAFVSVDEQAARAAAEAADGAEPISPLHGVPFAVKEVIEIAGTPTAGGSRVLGEHVPRTDATVVRRLREAGAVLIGTQVSHELTCGLDEPPTRNPWNLDCYPGGSSAGAGVSVAVGSATFALGTDAAGSVRIPAAMTGTVGLKPTAGLVSTFGVLRQASAPSIDNVGIVARTARDAGHVLGAIAGPDPNDDRTLRNVAATTFDPVTNDADLRKFRIGRLGEKTRNALDENCALDPEIADAFDRACEEMKSAGAKVVPIELPSLASAPAAVSTFFSAELAAAHRDLMRERVGDYHPDVLVMLREAAELPSSHLTDAVGLRVRLHEEISEAFRVAGLTLLATPTTPRVAMPLATFRPTEELGTLIPYTCGFNLTGQPAISVPCGFSTEGLPIGLQFVGLHGQDHAVLLAAHVYEQRNSWHERSPTL